MMDFENRLFHQFNGIVTIKHQITRDFYDDAIFKNLKNCARVMSAFISQFEDHIAHHYYIDGERGEAKTIPLPRDLVEWEE